MRVVLDTNILVSALMVQIGKPAVIYRAWQEGHFTLLTCAEHSRRAASHAAEAKDRRAHQAL
jgi:predicted nucleic acid-binding protein